MWWLLPMCLPEQQSSMQQKNTMCRSYLISRTGSRTLLLHILKPVPTGNSAEEVSGQLREENLSNSDKITTVSPSLVEKLKGFGFSADLITNGVDTDIFKPMDGRREKRTWYSCG